MEFVYEILAALEPYPKMPFTGRAIEACEGKLKESDVQEQILLSRGQWAH